MTTKAANYPNASIDQYAETVGEYHGIYRSDGCADIDGFLRKLGGSKAYAEGAEALKVNRPGEFRVFLPHFTSHGRDKFTIAHELGHYFLHYVLPKKTEPMEFGRGARNRAETEANVFASALLMPRSHFVRVWREQRGDAWAVARHFEVSPKAVSVRAQVLNLT